MFNKGKLWGDKNNGMNLLDFLVKV